MGEADHGEAWELRLGEQVVARLAETYLNWPWFECTFRAVSDDARALEALIQFGEFARSGQLEPFTDAWNAARVALLDFDFSLTPPSTHPRGDQPTGAGHLLLLLRRDGTALVRYSSTPNVRSSRAATTPV